MNVELGDKLSCHPVLMIVVKVLFFRSIIGIYTSASSKIGAYAVLMMVVKALFFR